MIVGKWVTSSQEMSGMENDRSITFHILDPMKISLGLKYGCYKRAQIYSFHLQPVSGNAKNTQKEEDHC